MNFNSLDLYFGEPQRIVTAYFFTTFFGVLIFWAWFPSDNIVRSWKELCHDL
jgi:hypothetical protein